MSTQPGHQVLTLIWRVRGAARDALVSELASVGVSFPQALRALPDLHFARFLLLPADKGDSELLLEFGFDGWLAPLLSAVWRRAGAELAGLLRHCEVSEPIRDEAALQRFAVHHAVRAEVAYAAHDGLGVPVIRNDASLDRLLQSELDRAQAQGELSRHDGPLEVASALQAYARSAPDTWLGSLTRARPVTALERLALIRQRFLEVVLATVLVPWLESAHGLLALLRGRRPSTTEPEQGSTLRARGPIAQLVRVKPGKLRLFVLQLLLWLTHGWLGQRGATRGNALAQVHGLRWLLLPGPRLLLLAHADVGPARLLSLRGAAERRLSSLIWLQTAGFPGSFWSTLVASRREAALLRWLNGSLLPTELWYSAYPELTVAEIERNQRQRELLSRELDSERAGELCALL